MHIFLYKYSLTSYGTHEISIRPAPCPICLTNTDRISLSPLITRVARKCSNRVFSTFVLGLVAICWCWKIWTSHNFCYKCKNNTLLTYLISYLTSVHNIYTFGIASFAFNGLTIKLKYQVFAYKVLSAKLWVRLLFVTITSWILFVFL